MSIVQYLEDTKSSNQPLSRNLYTRLMEDILSGKLKNGDKLTEQRICDEYRVSRTPVRESLRQLEADGLVENIPNRGAFVTRLSSQDIGDIFALRESAEILAVRWAIERITEEELAKLTETFEFMTFYTKKNDATRMLSINMAFHKIIYEATHNRMLRRQLSTYQMFLKHSVPVIYYSIEQLEELLEEHRAIFSAFRNHDPEAGELAMRAHLKNEIRRQKRDSLNKENYSDI